MTKVLCCMNGIRMKEVFDKRKELNINCLMIHNGKVYNNDFPEGVTMVGDVQHYGMWLSYYNHANIDYVLIDAAIDITTLCYSIFKVGVYLVYPSETRYDELVEIIASDSEEVRQGKISKENFLNTLVWTPEQLVATIGMIEMKPFVPLIKLHKGRFVIDLIGEDLSKYNGYSVEVGSDNGVLSHNDAAYKCDICGKDISSKEDHIVNKVTRICKDCGDGIAYAINTYNEERGMK